MPKGLNLITIMKVVVVHASYQPPCSRCCHPGHPLGREHDANWIGEYHVSAMEKILRALDSCRCKKCVGDGCLEDDYDQEQICPDCNGKGYTDLAELDLAVTEEML